MPPHATWVNKSIFTRLEDVPSNPADVMDINSKYFDKIRIKKGRKEDPRPNDGKCQWNGCDKPGTHKAPLGRDREGQYLMFCINHVREYNKNYNYFSGLDDDSVARFQKDALTGHRPTWTMAANRNGKPTPPTESGSEAHEKVRLSVRMRAKMAQATSGTKATGRVRKLKTLEKKALDSLNLPHTANDEEIRLRYKELVKMHHPDANGGDRGSEEKLREIIQSYKFLKQAGFC